jgi:NAD(P)-dependent dehydrogenase (short-subunit alcohol dehydrogenase family)
MHVGTGTRAPVTGASRGIGRAMAAAPAARGATVGLLACPDSAVAAVAAELPGAPVPPAADVADADAVLRRVRGESAAPRRG